MNALLHVVECCPMAHIARGFVRGSFGFGGLPYPKLEKG